MIDIVFIFFKIIVYLTKNSSKFKEFLYHLNLFYIIYFYMKELMIPGEKKNKIIEK
jgi:hypothetical protein